MPSINSARYTQRIKETVKLRLSTISEKSPSFRSPHFNDPSKLNPPPLPVVALSPEETVQAYTARSRARDAAWLSHVHTEEKPVELVGSTLIYTDKRLAHPPRS